ncbi:MAG TPA: NYN domain-containing protein [Candidatus Paceibacterota bacterium]
MNPGVNIQVFIDLENIQPPFAEERARYRLSSLFQGIEKYLLANGYQIERIWACARERLPKETKRAIDSVFSEFGAIMSWTRHVIADKEIERELLRRRYDGDLSPAILFISGDNDFAEVLCGLRANGTEILVSGRQVGRRLKANADRVVDYIDLMR